MDSTNTILTEADFGEGINATGLSQALVTASGTEGHILYGKFPQLYEENSTTPRAYTARDIMAALSATETKTENGEEVTVPVFGDDAATTQAFAEIVAANIGSAAKITPDSTSGNFINLAAGYYLIQDEYGDMHVAHLSNVGWIPMDSLKAIGDEIIAWMPLPEPYQSND